MFVTVALKGWHLLPFFAILNVIQFMDKKMAQTKDTKEVTKPYDNATIAATTAGGFGLGYLLVPGTIVFAGLCAIFIFLFIKISR